MPELIIESNGRLDKTAVYLNGEQLAGVREILLNLDEEGTFDAMITYKGGDGELYIKSIFSDYLTALQTTEPSFTEEEARMLESITIDSDGDIEDTIVAWNDEELDGIVSLFVHIKGEAESERSLMDRIRGKKPEIKGVECKAEIVFRDIDDSEYLETVF